MNAIEIAALGLRHDAERLTTIGHNVANASTPGYKRQMLVQGAFASAFEAAALDAGGMQRHVDARPGKVQATGRSLDLALAAGQYLIVQRHDGSLALTRQAELDIGAAGALVTRGGSPVLTDGGSITVPRSASAVRIDSSGRVFADDQLLGSLRLVALRAGIEPVPLGDGLFQADSAQWSADAPSGGLQVGYVEASNVVAAHEMVQLMTTARHAESMVRLIQSADSMLETAVRKFGEV